MTTDAATLIERVLSVQAELVRQVQTLTTEVRRLHRGQADDFTAELVQATHAAMAGRVFTAAELLACSLRLDSIGLRLATLLDGRTVRSVGRMLAGAADKATEDGLVLRRVGADRAGAIWCVTETR
ncbi:MAG: hypothetical protein MUF16_11770 [Burkholderiaceae bacterium]|nr:hypothetical protein [Burkholderiaceae bacterium]